MIPPSDRSRPLPARRALWTLPLAALTLLAGCSAGTAAPAPATASAPPPATAPAPAAPAGSAVGSPSTAPLSTTSTAPVRRLTLTVAGGKVTGDTGTVRVRIGEPLQLTVHSDVADEVHVHGADIGREVSAGGTVVIDVVQRAPGRFEVELERRKQVLTRLQVS